LKVLENPLFNALVVGDSVTADIKYKPAITFKPFAKLVFSTNNLPVSKNLSEGYFRRFDTLEFKKKFTRGNCDRRLQEKLDKELEGILLWAIEGLCRLMKNGEFTESIDFLTSFKEFEAAQNPLEDFLNTTTKINPNSTVKTKDLRNKYNSYCVENQIKPLSEIALGRFLKSKDIKKIRKQENNNKQECYYTNIELIE